MLSAQAYIISKHNLCSNLSTNRLQVTTINNVSPTSSPDECFNAAPASRRPRPIIAFVAMVCSVDFVERGFCVGVASCEFQFFRLISHFLSLLLSEGSFRAIPFILFSHNNGPICVEYIALNNKVLQEVDRRS